MDFLDRDLMESERELLTGTRDIFEQMNWFAERGVRTTERRGDRIDSRGKIQRRTGLVVGYVLWGNELKEWMKIELVSEQRKAA